MPVDTKDIRHLRPPCGPARSTLPVLVIAA